ncbi:MAG TPA: M10 family metallopeptidase C-terminal domain-containing protein, partial [Allosphingosinicella sp.]|nr:M10 family metallopeptidase C-terminal domain-containing protein [Allosphingosinicella sp.]
AGGIDTLDLSGFKSPSRIDLEPGTFSDAGGMTGNISIAYGAFIENAVGGSGNDLVRGNSASNVIEGGGGGDTLYGSAGADIFRFNALADSRTYGHRSDGRKLLPDFLADFESGVDRIDLSAVDAIAGTAENDSFTYIGSNSFSSRAGELRHEVRDSRVHVYGDMDGDGVADLHIIVAGTAIQPTDFLL